MPFIKEVVFSPVGWFVSRRITEQIGLNPQSTPLSVGPIQDLVFLSFFKVASQGVFCFLFVFFWTFCLIS